ncbi:MAG TPA: glycosyltransferase family 39 protein, partial [Chthonomonadales bacterium]|nr:glycosyltransferase family 39 protein [Chthonomonadales bacterium]
AASHLNTYRAFWSCDSGARFAMIQNWIQQGSLVYLRYENRFLDPTGELHPLGMAASITPSGHMQLRHMPVEFTQNSDVREKIRPTHGFVMDLRKGYATVCLPLFALLGGIGYRLMGFGGLLLFPLLAGVGTIIVTYATAGRLGLQNRVLLMLALGLATPLLLYSVVFWDHSLHMFLVAMTGYLFLRALEAKRAGYAALAGVAVGLGVWFHAMFPLLFAASTLAAIPLVRNRPLCRLVAAYVLGFTFPVAVWAYVNCRIYGTVGGPYTLMHSAISESLRQQAFDFPHFVARSLLQLVGATALSMPALQMLLLLPAYALTTWIGGRVRILGTVILVALAVLSYQQVSHVEWASGLFQATPLLIPAIGALYAVGERHRHASSKGGYDDTFLSWIRRACLLFGLFVLVNPISPALNWGSRYLLTALPWLALLVAHRLEQDYNIASRLGRWVVAMCAGVLIAVSLYSQYLGFLAIRKDLDYSRELNRVVDSAPTQVVVTDIYWLGAELTTVPPKRTLFLVRDTDEARRALFRALDRLGATTFTYFGDRPGLALLTPAAAALDWPYKIVETDCRCGRQFVRFARQPRGFAAKENKIGHAQPME